MRNRCKDINDVMVEAYTSSQVQMGTDDINFVELKKQSWFKKLLEKVKGDGVLTDKDVEKRAKQIYGDDMEAKKQVLITNIASVLSADRRPDIRDLFYHKAAEMVSEQASNLPDVEGGYYLGREDDGTWLVNLQKLPYEMVLLLAVHLNEDLMPMEYDSDLNIGTGWFGGILYEYLLPKNVAYKTTSPWLAKFVKTLTFFRQKIESMEKRFTNKNPNAILAEYEHEPLFKKNGELIRDKDGQPVFGKKPIRYNRRTHGIKELYSELDELQKDVGYRYFANTEELMHFVHLSMMDGMVYVDSDGKAWLKTGYGKQMKGDKVARHEDGNPKYDFFDKEPLIMKNGRIANFDKKTRNISKVNVGTKEEPNWVNDKGDDVEYLIFEPDVRKIYHKSDKNILHEWMRALQVNLWNFGRTVSTRAEEQADQFRKLFATARDALPEDQLALFDDLASQFFEGIDDDDVYEVHGLNKFRMKDKNKWYFPKKLTPSMRLMVLSLAERNLEAQIDNRAATLDLDDDSLGEGSVKRGRIKRRTMKEAQWDDVQSLRVIEEKLEILSNAGTQFDDTNSNNPVFLQTYMQNFRTVTNMIPYQAYRIDEMVVTDYIAEQSRQLERREVALDLLKMFIETADKPKVRAYAYNMFKRAFQYPDAHGRFAGLSVTDDQLDRVFRKLMPGYKGGKHNINRFLKDLSGLHTGNLLMGPTDGFVNYFSMMQDMITSGMEDFTAAYNEYDTNRELWEGRAERAGVVTFSKYLEGYVDEILRTEDRDQAKKYKKIIMENIDKIESMPIKELSQKTILKRLQRDLKTLDKIIPKRMQVIATSMAKYAINHRLEMGKFEKGKYKGLKNFLNKYSKVPSIQDTEKVLRTVSFIIGWKNSEKLLRGMPNVTDVEKTQLAKEYVYATQFGLESYLVGEALGSSVTKFMNGITTFRKQKTAWDISKNRDWIRTYWNPRRLLDEKIDQTKKSRMYPLLKSGEASAKALLRMVFSMGPGWKNRRKLLRAAAPHLAQGDAFFLTYGLGSAFMHFIVFANPVMGAISEGIKKLVFESKTTRLGTGFMSPYYMGILATGSLGLAFSRNFNDDEEDDLNFYDFYRFFRSLYGTGFMDLFAISYGASQAVKKYVTGEPKPVQNWYTDPMQHTTTKTGVTKRARQITEPIYEYGKKNYMDWEMEQPNFGNY